MEILGVTIQGGMYILSSESSSPNPSPSLSYGYVSGGNQPGSSAPSYVENTIQKFSFISDANATDVGDLTVGRNYVSGQSSSVSGYTSGGNTGLNPNDRTIIDKFPFASDNNATDVGNLTIFFQEYGRQNAVGQSSTDNGYASGGVSNNYETSVDKFPFSSDSNASIMGDLTVHRDLAAGQSSTDNGYTSGGWSSTTSSATNIIDKFTFSTDGNATDVGGFDRR